MKVQVLITTEKGEEKPSHLLMVQIKKAIDKIIEVVKSDKKNALTKVMSLHSYLREWEKAIKK